MRIRTLTAAMTLCAIMVTALAPGQARAQAGDWQPQLDPPQAPPNRGEQEPFVIRLSAPYDASSGRLALELDNIDVTARVRPLDTSYTAFEFAPFTPLPRGPHVLRMVEYANDGNIVERGRWAFTVQTVETAFDASVNSAVSYRFAGSPADFGWPGRTQAQGSVHFDTYTDDGTRRYAATGNLLIDTNAMTTTAGEAPRDVDLGDFLLSYDTASANVSAGHHVPGAARGLGQRSLIFDGYARRGLSGTVRSGDGTAFTGFALRSEIIRGFDHGMGVGDPDNRIAGAMFRTQPLANVALALGYVNGEGSDAGFATGSPGSSLAGHAGNLVVDSRWFEQRLSLRAEAAYSAVELGETFGTDTDQAYGAGLVWQPRQGLKIGERYVPWNANVNYTRVGSGFHSIGNLQQVANIEEVRAGINAYMAGLNMGLGAARVEDNVDSGLYPSTQSDSVNLSLNWTPAVSADFGGALFGRPTLGVNLVGDWRETVRMPPASFALPTDMDTQGITTFASFRHPYGAWTVSFNHTDIVDHTDVMPDYRYDSTGLSLSFQLGNRYSVAPGVQFDVTRDRDSGVDRRATSVTLSQNWAIVVDKLYWSLTASYNGNRLSDDTSDLAQSVVNTTLSWKQGLFSFWLQGAWSDTDNAIYDPFSSMTTDFSQDAYQVFLGISLNWPGNNRPATQAAASAAGGMQP